MAYLLFESEDNDKSMLEYLNRVKYPALEETCFAGFEYKFQESKAFYFGFYAHPDVLKLVEEINNQFSNIKIVVVDFREFEVPINAYFYQNDGSFKSSKIHHFITFRVELNDGYNRGSKLILNLAMAEFLRGYCPQFSHFLNTFKIKDNYINGMLIAQEGSNYGCWLCCDDRYEYTCSRDEFNSFDNIELVNNCSGDIEDDEDSALMVSSVLNRMRDLSEAA